MLRISVQMGLLGKPIIYTCLHVEWSLGWITLLFLLEVHFIWEAMHLCISHLYHEPPRGEGASVGIYLVGSWALVVNWTTFKLIYACYTYFPDHRKTDSECVICKSLLFHGLRGKHYIVVSFSSRYLILYFIKTKIKHPVFLSGHWWAPLTCWGIYCVHQLIVKYLLMCQF